MVAGDIVAYIIDILQEIGYNPGAPNQHKKESDMKISNRIKLSEWLAGCAVNLHRQVRR